MDISQNTSKLASIMRERGLIGPIVPTNEAILTGLGLDTIIGSKRKKHKRYNATTDMVEAETTILGG